MMMIRAATSAGKYEWPVVTPTTIQTMTATIDAVADQPGRQLERFLLGGGSPVSIGGRSVISGILGSEFPSHSTARMRERLMRVTMVLDRERLCATRRCRNDP